MQKPRLTVNVSVPADQWAAASIDQSTTSMLNPRSGLRRYSRPDRFPPTFNRLHGPASARLPSNAEPMDASQPCEDCERATLSTSYCVNCDITYCDECWPRALPHRPGNIGPGGFAHEIANPRTVARLRDIPTPPADT